MGIVQMLQGDRWLKHPAHPALVALPIGLWAFGLVMDAVASVTKDYCAQEAADLAVTGGVIGAALSATTGLAEYQRTEPNSPAAEIALVHGTLNATATALFALNAGLRNSRKKRGESVGALPKLMSLAGVGLVAYTGWLGGMLAYKHGVGVDLQEAVKEPHRVTREATPTHREVEPAPTV